VPKITVRIYEFDSDLPSAALFRIDRHYAAFALFRGEAINDEDLLAESYARLHVEQPTVTAHRHRSGYSSERMVPRSPSVDFDGNRKRKALATAAFDHRNLLRDVGNCPLI